MLGIIIMHVRVVAFYNLLIAPWFLAGFFFVAGVTFKRYSSFADFLFRKIRALLLPVFSFGLLNAILTYFAFDISLPDRLLGIICQIPGHGDDMWFVACLFVMCLMYYPISKINRTWIRFGVCLAVWTVGMLLHIIVEYLPWHIITACIMLVILDAGYAFKNLNGYAKLKSLLRRCCWGYVFIVWLVFVSVSFLCSNSAVDIHLNKYGDMVAYYLNLILALLTLVATSIKLEEHEASYAAKAFSFVGCHSLTYYGLQSKAITIVLTLLSVLGLSVISLIAQPVVAVLILVLLSPVVYFVDRYMPFMCGKKMI